MKLKSIYEQPERCWVLFKLLAERDETTNISHKKLPQWDEHVDFVESRPYAVWDFIEAEGEIVGACYLSKQNEIGIFIFREHQGKGYGPAAVKALTEKCGDRRYLANVNPRNERSASVFSALGFKIVQHTYSNK